MAESSNPTQIPSPPELIPKEEPDTQPQNRPESLNPFLPALQVEFNFDEITFNTNNEEKVVPYPSFIYLLLEYMMPAYGNDDLTLNPTQVFSVHNWALKPNQPEGPPFTDHMMAICNAEVPMKFRAPKPPQHLRRFPKEKGLALNFDSEENKLQSTHLSPKLRQTKVGLLKVPLESKLAIQIKKLNPVRPWIQTKASLQLLAKMHKEDQQAVGGPTSLGATNEGASDPQLSGGMSTSNHFKLFSLLLPFFHSESASRCDALADSTPEADHGISAPNDSIPLQQGMDEGTQNYSLDHIFVGTNLNVLVDKTKFAEDGLKTAHTNLGTNVESSSGEISKKIKLEDLSKLVQDVKTVFIDLDSLEDEPIIVTNESEEEEETEKYEDTHATSHDETKDSSAPHPPSPKLVQLQELKDQVLLLQSQNLKLEQQKVKAEVAFLKAQPSYPNVTQLIELLVTSLKPELSQLLASYDFRSFIPTKLKELPFKITELSGEVKDLKKHVQGLEIELPEDLKEIPNKLETKEFPVEFLVLPSQVSSVQVKLKTLDALLSLLKKVTNTLNSPLKITPQTEGELIKKGKGKEAMSSKDAEEEKTESDFENDYANPVDSMIESSKKKKLKKFDFVNKGGDHVHLNKEQIKEQNRIKESHKAELAKQEVEMVKNELVVLMGIDMVT
ncbi:hypothetical protein Tco_0445270 [Tanacetum coccineum]